jgi:UDP-N-acetylglucosamine 2-epimerase (non-hydrolysing)
VRTGARDPARALPFVRLMDHSYLMIADSSGVQDQAPSLGKPVLVARRLTEQPEATGSGCAKLVGASGDAITKNVAALLVDPPRRAQMSARGNPYRDDRAGQRIIDILCEGSADPEWSPTTRKKQQGSSECRGKW